MKNRFRLVPAWAALWLVVVGSAGLPLTGRAEPGGPPEAAVASPAAPLPAARPSAPVVVWGRTLVEYRLPLEFADVEQRAQATARRIGDSLGEIDAGAIVVQPVTIGSAKGVFLSSG